MSLLFSVSGVCGPLREPTGNIVLAGDITSDLTSPSWNAGVSWSCREGWARFAWRGWMSRSPPSVAGHFEIPCNNACMSRLYEQFQTHRRLRVSMYSFSLSLDPIPRSIVTSELRYPPLYLSQEVPRLMRIWCAMSIQVTASFNSQGYRLLITGNEALKSKYKCQSRCTGRVTTAAV